MKKIALLSCLALGLAVAAGGALQDRTPMKVGIYDVDDLHTQRLDKGGAYLGFLNVPDLSAGLYELPRGARDTQTPHDRDEVYYVIAGKATFVADGDRRAVGPGSVIYVAKTTDHRFEEITEDLSVLVFFAAAAPPRTIPKRPTPQ